jgi:hypothetical protein
MLARVSSSLMRDLQIALQFGDRILISRQIGQNFWRQNEAKRFTRMSLSGRSGGRR